MKTTSRIETIFRSNLLIFKGDREKAKQATRSTLRHHLNLNSLWFPKRIEHGQRLYAED